MFGAKRHYQYLLKQNLISEGQHEAILSHLANKNQNTLRRGLTGAAILAIIIGVLSIVAANWHALADSFKLIVHFALNGALGYGVYRFSKTDKSFTQDMVLLALFGFTLTLIALIGQTFQIKGNLANALILWMLISSPMIFFFGRTKLTYIPWMVALVTTIIAAMFEYLDRFDDYWFLFYTYLNIVFIPLCLIVDGRYPLFRKLKPEFAELFVKTGIVSMVVIASIAANFWYLDFAREFEKLADSARKVNYEQAYAFLWCIFLAAIGCLCLYLWRHKADLKDDTVKYAFVFLFVTTIFNSLPFLFLTDEANLIAICAFLGYWVFIGWIGQKLQSSAIVTLAISVLAIRIFVVYLEAFGGLMFTGFGLISGGLVMLVLIAIAKKLDRNLRGQIKGQAA